MRLLLALVLWAGLVSPQSIIIVKKKAGGGAAPTRSNIQACNAITITNGVGVCNLTFTTTTGRTLAIGINLVDYSHVIESVVYSGGGGTCAAATTATSAASTGMVQIWYCPNITGGASQTITVNLTGTGADTGYFGINEIAGASTSTPLDKTANQGGTCQTAVGAGTDALTSGNTATLASATEYVFGFVALSVTGIVSHGTNFTAGAVFGDGYDLDEWKQTSTTIPVAAVFSNSNTTDACVHAATFKP